VSDGNNPLSRWSQRKAAARRGEICDDEEVAPARSERAPAPPEPAAAAEPAVEPEADAPALPSIDELDAQSDYSVFLAKNVPEALRRAALRKLWASDPVFANLDGLNDYDEDFNLATTVGGAVQSAWQTGHGYVDEVEDKLEQVEQTVGRTGAAADSHDERVENAEDDAAAVEAVLSENDAAMGETADATRQATAAAPDPNSPEPAKEPGK